MGEPIVSASGTSGTVKLYDDRIEIVHDGIGGTLMHLGQGDKSIPIDHVSSIDLKEAGRLSSGYIEIVSSGREGVGSALSADTNEYTIHFQSGEESQFKELRSTFYDIRQSEDGNGGENENPLDVLKRRFARGEIDEEEYERKRELLEE